MGGSLMDRPGYRKLLTLGYDIIIQALPFHIYTTLGTMTKIVDWYSLGAIIVWKNILLADTAQICEKGTFRLRDIPPEKFLCAPTKFGILATGPKSWV